ncbi:hypothetical protein ACFLKB_08380 [Clostridium sp. FAM 1755]|uniref:hypothetical protein n=1 Tax=Clostridium caseinilyticum TaxID=3350403 RepID=UPI0038F6D071
MKSKAKTNSISSTNKSTFNISEIKPRIRHIIGYPKNNSDKSDGLLGLLFKFNIIAIGRIREINEIIKNIPSLVKFFLLISKPI